MGVPVSDCIHSEHRCRSCSLHSGQEMMLGWPHDCHSVRSLHHTLLQIMSEIIMIEPCVVVCMYVVRCAGFLQLGTAHSGVVLHSHPII